jgi:hypothetical protein
MNALLPEVGFGKVREGLEKRGNRQVLDYEPVVSEVRVDGILLNTEIGSQNTRMGNEMTAV